MDIEKELNIAVVNEVFAENKVHILEKELKQAQDRIKQLEQALESITKQVPAQDGGGFFYLRFDGEGNEIGVEYIDPMTIVSKMYSIAIEAIEINKTKL